MAYIFDLSMSLSSRRVQHFRDTAVTQVTIPEDNSRSPQLPLQNFSCYWRQRCIRGLLHDTNCGRLPLDSALHHPKHFACRATQFSPPVAGCLHRRSLADPARLCAVSNFERLAIYCSAKDLAFFCGPKATAGLCLPSELANVLAPALHPKR